MKKQLKILTKSVNIRGVKGTIYQVFRTLIISKIANRTIKNEFNSSSKEYGLNKESREDKIIVSLTAIPSRINKTKYVVDRLLKQTLKPDEIILYLGEDEFNNVKLPSEFNILEKRGLKIEYVENIGPHKKYYYAMQANPSSIIITVDDDRIYPKDLIQNLYQSYLEFPHAISGNWIKKMMIRDGKFIPHQDWPRVTSYDGIPNFQYFAIGADGILYPPNILPKEAFNLSQIKNLSYKADDVWLKGMELLNNIPVVKAKGLGDKTLFDITGTQDEALFHENEGKDKNGIYLDNVFKTYGLFSFFK